MTDPLSLDDTYPRSRRSALAYGTCVVAVLVAAAVTRFAALESYPTVCHVDELSNTYDGYSIATTGADRAGTQFPILVRGMGPGDYRPALYAYLTAATTSVLGFSIWAGRLPAAIAGVIAVYLVFLVTRRLLGQTTALIAMFFATFSPILIQYARQGHEGTALAPLFAILIVYLLLRALDHRVDADRSRGQLWWLAAAGLAMGLSANVYGTMRLTAPLLGLIAVVLITLQIAWRQRSPKRAIVAVTVFALPAAIAVFPQFYAMLDQPEHFFARAKVVGHNWQSGMQKWSIRLVEGYAAHLDPRGLLFSNGEYAELSVARLSIVALPFLYMGLLVTAWRAIIRRHAGYFLLLAAVLIAIAPAIASKRNLGILRAAGVWSLYPVICAVGAAWLATTARQIWHGLCARNKATDRPVTFDRPALVATACLAVAISATGINTIHRYLAEPTWRHPTWYDSAVYQVQLVRVGSYLAPRHHEYQRVYVDAPGFFGFLYIAAFSGMTPAEYQDTPRDGDATWDGWDRIDRFGKFHFADRSRAESDWSASDRDRTWLFVSADGHTVTFRPEAGAHESIDLALAGSGTAPPDRPHAPISE